MRELAQDQPINTRATPVSGLHTYTALFAVGGEVR